jgi:tRNA(Ile)-lysidine synthase
VVGRVREHIKESKLIQDKSNLLLAISGGIDSMVMLHIFRQLPFNISVAHCNFSLRGEEADKDQELVESYCTKNDIRIYSKRFDTEVVARKRGISIQMAARDLRYSWFGELCQEHSLNNIVLGHNHNDIIETFLINLSRGTGLKGLTGIKSVNGNIIRPMLFASRDDIEEYAKENNVLYREDSSNKDIKYKRNLIRHKLIPLFKGLNPSFSSSMELTMKRLEEAERIIIEDINQVRERILVTENASIYVLTPDLLDLKPSDIYLYELFKEFGLGQSGIDELKKLITASPGKQLNTKSHNILKDRDRLIINSLEQNKNLNVKIINVDEINDNPEYDFQIKDVSEIEISNKANKAYLDYEKIKFPITIRSWQEGDWFYPFGMKGKKKLSDFYIDHKVPLHLKDTINLFTSSDSIFWVAGYRIDSRFSISERTQKVLIITKRD